MKHEVKIFNDEFNVNLTDIPKLKFLDFSEEGVEVKANTKEINGTDGVVMGPINFGPFDLVLNFSFIGHDIDDYNLMLQKLRRLLFKREAFYIWHSFMPGKKYAVYCTENAIDFKTPTFGTFSIKFSVIKGYSESLRETDKFSLSSGEWQFETGVLSVDDVKYKHNTTGFKIYNGSTDTIDPHIRHKFRLLINIDAPKGFTLTNNTTGDVFKYNKAIKKKQTLILNGVHPTIDNKRVGSNTNWQWITLVPGFNEIEITGENISNPTTQWVFPFIYR
ncbi:phage tail domain-containing protein [Staphylococcus gallinarum]|uniref:Holin n=3 Tax=Staphylococcus gallinarum TaxID=1293 RepID=A0ABQ0Y281_STAGA|nr:phage tail domain-containing protein [Staphylococcus gallinarum]KIR11534.1 holin [Staphylococcus gallinarum]GEQ05507.1 holin [Staphylococcus gallinarum]